MAQLGLNIDHIATVRQARGGTEPDPVAGAIVGELAGATCITAHLREDRRHVQDRDVFVLREVVQTRLNLEMAAVDDMTKLALDLRPDQATLVPERREELTTEGGLDVVGQLEAVERSTGHLTAKGIVVSLFIDPDEAQVAASAEVGANAIELHTGTYANTSGEKREAELARLRAAAEQAHALGLAVHAGHGLTLVNVDPIAALPHIADLNIGHSIVSRAIFVGLEQAVREMAARIR